MTRISVSEKIIEKRYKEIRMTLEKGATIRIASEVLGIELPYEEFRRIITQKYPGMLRETAMKNRSRTSKACRKGTSEKEASRRDQARRETLKDL